MRLLLRLLVLGALRGVPAEGVTEEMAGSSRRRIPEAGIPIELRMLSWRMLGAEDSVGCLLSAATRTDVDIIVLRTFRVRKWSGIFVGDQCPLFYWLHCTSSIA